MAGLVNAGAGLNRGAQQASHAGGGIMGVHQNNHADMIPSEGSSAVKVPPHAAGSHPGAAASNPGMPQAGALTQALTQHLSSLPDQAKQYIAQINTPEFATAMGMIMGPEAGSLFMKYANPNKILVPMDRKSAQGQNTSQPGATTPPAAGVSPKPAGVQPKPAGIMAPSQPNPAGQAPQA